MGGGGWLDQSDTISSLSKKSKGKGKREVAGGDNNHWGSSRKRTVQLAPPLPLPHRDEEVEKTDKILVQDEAVQVDEHRTPSPKVLTSSDSVDETQHIVQCEDPLNLLFQVCEQQWTSSPKDLSELKGLVVMDEGGGCDDL